MLTPVATEVLALMEKKPGAEVGAKDCHSFPTLEIRKLRHREVK